MVKVNILTYLGYNLFDQQLDLNRYGGEFSFYENSELDVVWDLIVVFEDISLPKSLKVRKGGLVFIAAEPPMSSVYTSRYLSQFDTLFVAHPRHKSRRNVVYKQFFNDWHFGLDFKTKKYKYSFENIRNLTLPVKSKNISVITSSQAKLPGHLLRLDFLRRIQEVFRDEIDFFGHGSNPVDDKADALLPYRFHICIENEVLCDLWTEKFADPVLAFSVPIYIGCVNMGDYFPRNSFYQLDLGNWDESVALLTKILSDPVKHYNDKLDSLHLSRRLLIEKYNIYPTLVDLFHSKVGSLGNGVETRILPNHSTFAFTFLNNMLRFRRFLFKRVFFFKQQVRWFY